MTLKPGDKVRITKKAYGHTYNIGSIVTIKRAYNPDVIGKIIYECEEKVYGYTWYIYPEEHEVIPPQLTLKLTPL